MLAKSFRGATALVAPIPKANCRKRLKHIHLRSLISGIEPETITLGKLQNYYYIKYVSISKTNTKSEIFTNKEKQLQSTKIIRRTT